MPKKKKVLFVCVHNSARSQMAEAFLNSMAGDLFEAESAGLQPGKLNLLAVAVMKEIGIDISGKQPRSIQQVINSGKKFDVLISVCEEAEYCPVVPGIREQIHWSFPDPSRFEGSLEERLNQTRKVRDQIQAMVSKWVAEKRKQGENYGEEML